METIQIVLDSQLLKAADRAARRLKTNRSALFRDALRAHLKAIAALEREERDRQGYLKYPEVLDRAGVWDQVADWPDE